MYSLSRLLLAASGSLLSLSFITAQVSPVTPKAAHIRITQGPEIELAKVHLTIIRWTSSNPGGSPVHYGVVHYGTDPHDLNQTASSPLRLDPGHPYTVFRVRMDRLKPATAYYYTVGSMGSDGTVDQTDKAVHRFTTPASDQENTTSTARR